MKYANKKLAWLMALCMFFSVFTGIMPVRIHAAEKSLGITIDGRQDEWQTLVSEGKAQKVGEGSDHTFGTVTTTSGALYLV